MDLSFTAGDLIQIIVILASLMTAYWKLSNRISLVEAKTRDLERDGRTNESKLEKKIDTLSVKIDALLVEVTAIKAKTNN